MNLSSAFNQLSLPLLQGQVRHPLHLLLVWVYFLQDIGQKLHQLGIKDTGLLGPELLQEICCRHWSPLQIPTNSLFSDGLSAWSSRTRSSSRSKLLKSRFLCIGFVDSIGPLQIPTNSLFSD